MPHCHKLQALVYDILPSTTAVFSFAIASRKLSANEQFLVGAQTVVSLLQTTQIKQGVSFIAANKVYQIACICTYLAFVKGLPDCDVHVLIWLLSNVDTRLYPYVLIWLLSKVYLSGFILECDVHVLTWLLSKVQTLLRCACA